MKAAEAVTRPGRWRLASSRRRQMAVWAVLLGHAALLLLIWQARRWPAAGEEARRSVVLRLLPPPPQLHQRAARVQARQPTAPSPGISPRPTPTLPGAPDGEGAPVVAATGAALSPGAAASAPGALNLRPSPEILRGALANPATTDPRSNSPRPTFEERIAMGLDPDLCVKLERDAEGVVRRRMGRLVNATSLLQSTHGVGARGLLVCE
ncbi:MULTISPECIES: hypothetical protein [unclassified Roseateles]|uniref:hypothetical protein n=1 Tax=Pelomonas sp. Root1237 TaxID=1736434 RepID=UPI0006FE4F17|nr:hypothetical protein [Pelomonas sp. Root1237]KQV95585.1 hypothetical protein ASC91_25100 [Pelomonas sp. Root1237]